MDPELINSEADQSQRQHIMARTTHSHSTVARAVAASRARTKRRLGPQRLGPQPFKPSLADWELNPAATRALVEASAAPPTTPGPVARAVVEASTAAPPTPAPVARVVVEAAPPTPAPPASLSVFAGMGGTGSAFSPRGNVCFNCDYCGDKNDSLESVMIHECCQCPSNLEIWTPGEAGRRIPAFLHDDIARSDAKLLKYNFHCYSGNEQLALVTGLSDQLDAANQRIEQLTSDIKNVRRARNGYRKACRAKKEAIKAKDKIITELEKEVDPAKCFLCMDEVAVCVVGCGCKVTCEECYAAVFDQDLEQCPLCREGIDMDSIFFKIKN